MAARWKNNALLFNIRTAGIFLRAGLKKISAESLFLLKTLTDKAEQRF